MASAWVWAAGCARASTRAGAQPAFARSTSVRFATCWATSAPPSGATTRVVDVVLRVVGVGCGSGRVVVTVVVVVAVVAGTAVVGGATT